jgi:Flp pilus assembly protein TadB
MKIVLRTVAVLFEAFGIFLIAAVINAVTSAGGARPGVAIAYVAGAIVLTVLAVWMWRRPSRAHSVAASPPVS